MWRILIVSLVFVGCAMPNANSARPRGLDVYTSGGRSIDRTPGYENTHSYDWQVGASIHWDLIYDDEYEEEVE